MANQISIRIDIRSSINMMILAVVAVATTLFLLSKANEAIDELQRLNETRAYLGQGR